ncbi:TM2 domain-containing protein 1 isoform X2 [Varanus komodoensis]|uniref:TM2 domain-containing protein 1 isoform X2 n=1 Tax=Varanus komodoensis TaxID=61221 RepID=UPI001CF7DEE4|nr:TM2 domain-containing protein 1 isoform X2 [Varanus komodoensis]
MAALQEKLLSGSERKKRSVVALWSVGALWLACLTTRAGAGGDPSLKCEDLRIGQYICEDPKIDNETQEPLKCTNHTAYVACLPAPNITCKDFNGSETQFTGTEIGFYKPVECRNVKLLHIDGPTDIFGIRKDLFPSPQVIWLILSFIDSFAFLFSNCSITLLISFIVAVFLI